MDMECVMIYIARVVLLFSSFSDRGLSCYSAYNIRRQSQQEKLSISCPFPNPNQSLSVQPKLGIFFFQI